MFFAIMPSNRLWTVLTSPATSFNTAFLNAVPELFVTVTQAVRSSFVSFLSSKAT